MSDLPERIPIAISTWSGKPRIYSGECLPADTVHYYHPDLVDELIELVEGCYESEGDMMPEWDGLAKAAIAKLKEGS